MLVQSNQNQALKGLLLVLATLVVVKQALLPFTAIFAGPASTFSAMIVATIMLRKSGLRWRDLGFRRPESWPKTLAGSLLIFLLILLVSGID